MESRSNRMISRDYFDKKISKIKWYRVRAKTLRCCPSTETKFGAKKKHSDDATSGSIFVFNLLLKWKIQVTMLRFLILVQISLALALRLQPDNKRFMSSLGATTAEQKQSGIGWDSHKAVDNIPESLVRTIDGNDSMRRKFEALCRNAQVII